MFHVVLADAPARKQDMAIGRYEFPLLRPGATVAVKIIDMLGEEHVTRISV